MGLKCGMIFIGFGSVFSVLHISELLLSEQPFFLGHVLQKLLHTF